MVIRKRDIARCFLIAVITNKRIGDVKRKRLIASLVNREGCIRLRDGYIVASRQRDDAVISDSASVCPTQVASTIGL